MTSMRFLPFVLMALATATVSAADSEWKAGVAREKITPTQPTWMSGYAGRNRPAEGTLHDLWAKALVVEDPAGNRLLAVSLDLVGIGRDISVAVCRELSAAHQLKRSQIALFTSHTHTGPVVGGNLATMYDLSEEQQSRVNQYAEFLKAAIQKAAAAAFNDLEPATLSFGVGEASFAVNRRNNREADVPKLREQGELKGPVDHSAPVLAVRNSDGDLKAVVFGYACHATVLSYYKWSGDWPGFAQIEVEKRHPEAVALFMAGCGADQNPLPRRTEELAANYGKQMADAVEDVLASDMQPVTGGLSSAYREIPLKLAELPDRAAIEKDTQSSNKYIVLRAKSLLQRMESEGSLSRHYPYPVQVWGVGSARLVILGGEVVVDYSLRLRRQYGDRALWVAGYSNDVMAYIPSKRVLKEGGYEGASSMIYYGLPTVWADNVEEHVVSTVSMLVSQVDRQQQQKDQADGPPRVIPGKL